MAEYDLTPKISNYLDIHLIYPLLQYLSARNIYDPKSLMQKELELLSHTKMSDYEGLVYKKYHETTNLPKGFDEMRNERIQKIKETSEKAEVIMEILTPECLQTLRRFDDLNEKLDELKRYHNFDPASLDTLLEAAEVYYDASLYTKALDTLTCVRSLLALNDELYIRCCWGILASCILTKEYDRCMEEVYMLKAVIDFQSEEKKNSEVYLVQLQQRTWMLHWSLLVFFSHTNGKEKLVDWFLNNPNHMNAIQTSAPHLLRYLAVCVVLSQDRNRKTHLKDLVHLIQQERYSYHDPITEFLECLYVKFDFDGAQEKLKICETVLQNDFFVSNYCDEFMENARLLMLETFCRIHHCVGISMLAQRVNMTDEAVENWIIDLIKNDKIEAKIDSEKGQIIMDTQTVSPYEQVIERTKDKMRFIANVQLHFGKDTKMNSDNLLPV